MGFRKATKGVKRKDKRGGVKRVTSNLPDEIDAKLLAIEIGKLSKGLDEKGRPPPLTENKMKAIIRDAVRKKWMSCPSKLAFLESKGEWDYDPTERRLRKWCCNICKEYFTKTAVQVDHIKQEESFLDLGASIMNWGGAILNAGGEEDLQIVCIECHGIKSQCDSMGLDFTNPEDWEIARKEKMYLAWKKEQKTALNQKNFLLKKGFTEEQVKNAEGRRESYLLMITEREQK